MLGLETHLKKTAHEWERRHREYVGERRLETGEGHRLNSGRSGCCYEMQTGPTSLPLPLRTCVLNLVSHRPGLRPLEQEWEH